MKRILLFLSFILLSLFPTFTMGEEKKGDWCGTIPALSLFLEGLPIQRPDLTPEEFIERENFRIHFTRSGPNACDSAYAIAVADYIEYSWHKQMDTLNWAPPPPDYGAGGDERYDIYIYDLPSGIGGWCVAEAWYSDPYPDGATSWIGIDNQLGMGNFLKIVASHEFSHASQFRYSAREMQFIYENTAVWMEDVCYESINDYIGYLSTSPNPLGNPDYPITSTQNLYLYAGGIWFMFLEDYYDIDCPRRVWEMMGEVPGQNTLFGTDSVLRVYYSSSLREALKYYGLWRYFVGPRADTVNYFKEGHLWPSPYLLRTHYEYPNWGSEDPRPPFAPGGTDFIQLRNGGGKLFITFNGEDRYKWRFWVVGYKPINPNLFELTLDSVSSAGRDSFNWREEDHFALIPVVCDWEYLSGALIFDYETDCRILKDVGVLSIVGIPNSGDTGDVLVPKAWIKNYGISQETFLANFRVGEFYSDTRLHTLPSGDSLLLEFSPCTLFARGYQNYICTLALDGDERLANNSKTGRVLTLVRDVGVLSILEPIGSFPQGSRITPKARIKNFGNLPLQFDVIFSIENWRTTKRINLAAGREYDLIFDSTYLASDTGEFVAKCSTAYPNDKNPLNNKVEDHFFVRPSGIIEERVIGGNLGKGRIEVYASSGVLVWAGEGQKVREVMNGLPAGIYFLNSPTPSQRVRKILIIR